MSVTVVYRKKWISVFVTIRLVLQNTVIYVYLLSVNIILLPGGFIGNLAKILARIIIKL